MKPQGHSPVPVWLGVATLVLYAVICQRITPNAAIPGPLRLDIVVLALGGAGTVFPNTRRTEGVAPGEWQRGRPAGKWVGATPWIRLAVSGALLGAAAVAPWVAVAWLVVAALAFAWGGRRRGRRARRRALALVVILLAAGLNLTVVSAVMARGFRVDPDDFASLDFRVNTLLADVPIHDVWAIELAGDGPATMDDAAAAFRRFRPFQSTPAVLVLGVVRGVLGHVLGWEDPRWRAPETSFVHRLTEHDHQRSTPDPGTEWGMWTLLYSFPKEGAIETINGTVHLAVACAIENGASGSTLYLVFRVKEVNWTTPYYMRLIDPFRRYFVYPSLFRQFAHLWKTD